MPNKRVRERNIKSGDKIFTQIFLVRMKSSRFDDDVIEKEYRVIWIELFDYGCCCYLNGKSRNVSKFGVIFLTQPLFCLRWNQYLSGFLSYMMTYVWLGHEDSTSTLYRNDCNDIDKKKLSKKIDNVWIKHKICVVYSLKAIFTLCWWIISSTMKQKQAKAKNVCV